MTAFMIFRSPVIARRHSRRGNPAIWRFAQRVLDCRALACPEHAEGLAMATTPEPTN